MFEYKPKTKRVRKFDTRLEKWRILDAFCISDAYRVLFLDGRTVVERKDVEVYDSDNKVVRQRENIIKLDLSYPQMILNDTDADSLGTDPEGTLDIIKLTPSTFPVTGTIRTGTPHLTMSHSNLRISILELDGVDERQRFNIHPGWDTTIHHSLCITNVRKWESRDHTKRKLVVWTWPC